jgi:UDPglucose 6-dehydrogenase
MNIAIIGVGFVGNAVARAFENNNLLLIDPKLGTDIRDVINFEPNVSFVCTPTPSADTGQADLQLTLNTIHYLLVNTYGLVVVKSTVPPSFAEQFSNAERVVFNPEFLTERNAVSDMIWADSVILGGTDHATEVIEQYYRKYSICSASEYVHVSSEEACWIKYITNTMLAVKVAYLNQLYDSFVDKQSWSHVVNALKKDDRLGTSHWLVPGLDGKRGFGGACLPKDSKALLHEAPNLSILKSVIESNNYYRSLYEPEPRELEQNIKFKE